MRLAAEEKPSILVQIKIKERDEREHVEKDGKQVKNKMFGKMVYKTVDGGTLEIFDATPTEVKEIVLRAIHAAAAKPATQAAKK